MKKVSTVIVVSLLCIGSGLFCGNKKQEVKDIVVVGRDTITCDQLSVLSASKEEAHAKAKQLTLVWALAKQSSQTTDTAGFREVVGDFKDQLSRQSGREWSDDGAAAFYKASRMIKEKLETAKSLDAVKSAIDSIAGIIKTPSGCNSSPFDYARLFQDSVFSGSEADFAAILSSLFGTDENLSKSIANFIYSEALDSKEAAPVTDLVKGLVFDSAAVKKQQHSLAEKKYEPVENSALALKYRNQESIKTTISGHIPNLEALYKKILKLHPEMSGTVYVTFKVNYAGEVIGATIRTSEIKNETFINPLLEYVKKITFQPVPEKVGNMTFDFPFEFRKYE